MKDPKTGIFRFRKVVPDDLRVLVGKREVKRTLGTRDPREAKILHGRMAAEIDAEWAALRARSKGSGAPPKTFLTSEEARLNARWMHDRWLHLYQSHPLEHGFWRVDLYEQLWQSALSRALKEMDSIGPSETDRQAIRAMEAWCRQEAKKDGDANGWILDPGSLERSARALAARVQKASWQLIRFKRGEIDMVVPDLSEATKPQSPISEPPRRQSGAASAKKVSLSDLVEAWWVEAKATGRKPSTYESYRNSVRAFTAFLKHDDASRVTPHDVVAFKDHRLTHPSPRTGRVPSAKTVKDSDLAGLKTIFGWAVVNHRLPSNPATGVTIKVGKPPKTRGKGFTDDEALALLTASSLIQRGNESEGLYNAKRWVPWLSAFTGARVGELAQLRKEDVRKQGEFWTIRITPEAGTVKTNEAREIALHSQIVERGFIDFVMNTKEGHLFVTPAAGGDVLGPLQGVKNRLAEFGRSIVKDPRVAPNHAWRHRFTTIGIEHGVSERVLHAIQGHAPRSVADTYGEVSLKAKAAAIELFPRYDIGS